jgi:hypothetical protein
MLRTHWIRDCKYVGPKIGADPSEFDSIVGRRALKEIKFREGNTVDLLQPDKIIYFKSFS